MKVYLVTINTEDGERHQEVYNYKPTVEQYKKKFFEEHDIYEEDDWDNCIGHTIREFEVIQKS